VSFHEKCVAGRLRRRLLRTPVVDGWLCDEDEARPPERVSVAIEKLDDDAMGVRLPGRPDLARLGPEAAPWIGDGGELDVTVGWPEPMVVLRRGGVVVFAEGDAMHFGALPLDAERSVRRSGHQYLDAAGAEVKVELQMDELDEVTTAVLGPGETARFGPYSIFHERSSDPADRPTALKHHSYGLRIRRDPRAPVPVSPHADMLHPLDVESPHKVVELARRFGYLDEDEAMLCEPGELKERLRLYEGAAGQLEEALRGVGPDPATLHRRGESVRVVTAFVTRGERGQTLIGRATIFLHPTRMMQVSRLHLDALPGRMRRS
jgi:hypothetical protein